MSAKGKTKGANRPDYPHSIAANTYGFYCIPDIYEKREAPKILVRGEVYEADTIGLIRHLLQGGGDVISGGAFVGDFLPALHGAMGNSARLHTFEPNPFTRAATECTIALNGLKRVSLNPVAVGAEEAELSLQVTNAKGVALAGRSKIVGGEADGETLPVRVARLDDIVAKSRKVSLIHLDVEGHEVPALQGASRILENHAPILILEAQKGWMRRNIVEHLSEAHADLDYTFSGMVDRNAVYRAMARI